MSDVWSAVERPTRRGVALDVLGGVAFAVGMGALHLQIGPAAGVAAVLLGAALAVRRLSWPLMSALAIAAAVPQVATGQLAYLADLAYAALFATLGSSRSPLARRFGLGAAVVATVVGGLFIAFLPAGPDRSLLMTVVAVLGMAALTAVFTLGGWLLGYLRWQTRRAVQARVDARLEAAERRRVSELYDVEQERRRIAADMHDVVAHSWAVVAAQSDGARYALRHDPPAAERALEVIGETARTAIADLRTIVAQLRDPALAPSTPGHAQQQEVLDRMRASGMTVELHESGTRDDSPLVALTAHRLLAESLTNALKHGDLAGPVRVEQDWRDGYRLTVTNRLGDSTESGDATGHGLVGMAERATVAGGTFTAGPEGDAWVVRAHVPSAEAAS